MLSFNLKLRQTLPTVASFIFLIGLLFVSPQSQAGTGYKIEFTKFFTEYENFFLFRPELVRDVFFSVIEIKGNEKASRKQINYRVLGCQPDSGFNQGCRMDQLRLERKKLAIPKYVSIPVNFTHISSRVYNRRKKRVSIQWNPKLIRPPKLSVKAFF